MKFLQEMRHRQVFQLVGLYVVGAWVVIEVASVFFPAWGIPDAALRYLFVSAAALFPVVVLFGWLFDVRRDGVFRTVKSPAGGFEASGLTGRDYGMLSGLTIVAVAVLAVTLMQVWNTIGAISVTVEPDVVRPPNSVAVLPFANLDPNPDTGYFSDGVAEEILHRLAATRSMHVLGWRSSEAFRDSDLALAEISKLLAVEYLLEGSIRRDGQLVRVTARLTDESGVQIWSETFDRQLEAIFAIQSEIANAVASRIVAEIEAGGASPERRMTDNLEAYDEYLVGRKYAHDRLAGWHQEARAAFRRALELDPHYALAHAGLAYALFIMAPDLSEDSFAEALAAAERSIDLDPALAEGHAILGLLQANLGPDSLEQGIAHLRRALELDPSFSDTYNWLSLILRSVGKYEEADRLQEKGHEIDPLLPSMTANLAGRLSNDGDVDRALRILERHTHLPEMTNPILDGLTGINMEWGRYADALGWYDGPRTAFACQALGLTRTADSRVAAGPVASGEFLFQVVLPVLHARGEHQPARERLAAFLERQDLAYSDLPLIGFDQALVTLVKAGALDEAIREYESVPDSAPQTIMPPNYVIPGQDALNALAFAYQQTGFAGKAAELLAYRDDRIVRREPLSSPHFLEPMALNALLSGNHDVAYELLSRAVDLGWANYYLAINDPRWGDALLQPRFARLLEPVQANIAKQRAQVEARLQEQSE
ncbi:MAG: hypothetical protein P8X98_13350 [Woeseiaceae bacterium]